MLARHSGSGDSLSCSHGTPAPATSFSLATRPLRLSKSLSLSLSHTAQPATSSPTGYFSDLPQPEIATPIDLAD